LEAIIIKKRTASTRQLKGVLQDKENWMFFCTLITDINKRHLNNYQVLYTNALLPGANVIN